MDTGHNHRFWIVERLGNLRMTAAERKTAQAYVHQGALIADATLPAIASIRSIMERVGRGLRGFTHLSR
jgi:hypothetical protein